MIGTLNTAQVIVSVISGLFFSSALVDVCGIELAFALWVVVGTLVLLVGKYFVNKS